MDTNDRGNNLENKYDLTQLYKKVIAHIDHARKVLHRVVDAEMVRAYYCIGREIIQEEQKGSERAEYGSFLLQALSQRLTQQYGRGFSITTLKDIRKFYLVYSDFDKKRHALRGVFEVNFNPKLSWIHYRTLMRISRAKARQFYEIEAINNNWSGRELERQVNSLLFDRLLKSKDKQGLLELSRKGQEIQKFEDTIKEPLVLEFLSLPETHQLVESKLEEALINNLQHFLLELGKGFAFIGRQKRLTLDGNHFYADLVFYHVILKCYVIIDIKTQKLTHGDLG